jgi:hypothetical protein
MTLEAACQGLLYRISIQVACFFLSLLIIFGPHTIFKPLKLASLSPPHFTSTLLQSNHTSIEFVTALESVNMDKRDSPVQAAEFGMFVTLPRNSTIPPIADMPGE